MRSLLADMPAHGPMDLTDLCAATADLSGASGAGIMLMTGDVQRGSLCTTDDISAEIEELQYELREGPCVDAHVGQRMVSEADLAHPAVARWTAFSPAAVDAGVRAIFGFPLRVGTVRLGALNLYRDRPGGLSAEEHEDAGEMADLIAGQLLDLQSHAPAGEVASGLEEGANLQYEVHRAAGMVAAQLDVPVEEAMAVLRSHAIAHHERLADVAAKVTARELRFDPAG